MDNGVRNLYTFKDIPVFGVIGYTALTRKKVWGPLHRGLKLARICAEHAAMNNEVVYEERRRDDGVVVASGYIRNPMGF